MSKSLYREETSQILLAYLAGIVDGEGSIGIEILSPCKNRKKCYYVCRLTVVDTNTHLMQTLMRNLGGNYDTRKAIPGRKTCYRWHTFGKNLEVVITKLLPYLQLKYEQAELLLEYRKTVGKTGWNVSEEVLQKRHNLYIQCRDLNKVGS